MRELSEIELEGLDALAQSVDLPSPSHVVLELADLLEQESNPEPADIARIVQKDAGLVAKTLTVINAPTFAMRSSVSSVKHAYTLMGPSIFQAAVVSTALRESLGSYGIDTATLDQYWQHSTHVAQFCYQLAKRLPPEQAKHITAEHAYLLGLFHDIGLIILIRNNPDYLPLLKRCSQQRENPANLEKEHGYDQHAKVGYVCAARWRVDANIQQAILMHHHPFRTEKLKPADQVKSALLMLAEYLSMQSNKTSIFEQKHQTKEEILDAMGFLGLSTPTLKAILQLVIATEGEPEGHAQ